MAEQSSKPDDQHQTDGHQDQKVSDAQHGALEVRDVLGLLDETGGLAEIGFHPGGRDHAVHLALFGD